MKRLELISIDGSQGEGGGQILRTSLALSLITGKPFRVENVRAGRAKPGLLRQHLTALQAAAKIGDAVTDGAEIGSREFVFRPEAIKPGEYRFAVGSAGSAILVLQTVLPALMLASAPTRLVLEGGTHNPFAPTFDFLDRTFLPQLARFGPQVHATLVRPGFYPAGGGRVEVTVNPVSKLRSIDLCDRGEDRGRRVVAHVAGLPRHIAQRAFDQIQKRMGWDDSCLEIAEHPAEHGPGFVLTTHVESAEICETFTGFGEKGLPANRVADGAVDEVRHYLAAQVPVGEYLTDQLLVPLALAGTGRFVTAGLTRHARTNIAVIERFLPVKLVSTALENGTLEVSVVQADR